MSQDEQDTMLKHVSDVQARHADELLSYANVVGVGVGIAKINGEVTRELAVIVMVSEKLPVAQLALDDVLPHYLEGVRVDVQSTGGFSAFSGQSTGDFSAG